MYWVIPKEVYSGTQICLMLYWVVPKNISDWKFFGNVEHRVIQQVISLVLYWVVSKNSQFDERNLLWNLNLVNSVMGYTKKHSWLKTFRKWNTLVIQKNLSWNRNLPVIVLGCTKKISIWYWNFLKTYCIRLFQKMFLLEPNFVWYCIGLYQKRCWFILILNLLNDIGLFQKKLTLETKSA